MDLIEHIKETHILIYIPNLEGYYYLVFNLVVFFNFKVCYFVYLCGTRMALILNTYIYRLNKIRVNALMGWARAGCPCLRPCLRPVALSVRSYNLHIPTKRIVSKYYSVYDYTHNTYIVLHRQHIVMTYTTYT